MTTRTISNTVPGPILFGGGYDTILVTKTRDIRSSSDGVGGHGVLINYGTIFAANDGGDVTQLHPAFGRDHALTVWQEAACAAIPFDPREPALRAMYTRLMARAERQAATAATATGGPAARLTHEAGQAPAPSTLFRSRPFPRMHDRLDKRGCG